MEGDCEEHRLWIVEPAEIQMDLLSAKTFVKSTEQRTVSVRNGRNDGKTAVLDSAKAE